MLGFIDDGQMNAGRHEKIKGFFAAHGGDSRKWC